MSLAKLSTECPKASTSPRAAEANHDDNCPPAKRRKEDKERSHGAGHVIDAKSELSIPFAQHLCETDDVGCY